MKSRHPDRERLERFLDGELADDASSALQRHLFLCPVCEERLVQLLPEPGFSFPPQEGRRDWFRHLLDEHRAELGSRGLALSAERRAAPRLWRDLEALEPEPRRALVATEIRFQSWGLFELMVDRSRLMVIEDAHRAEEWLRLALEVAGRLAAEVYGRGAVETAKTRAWTWLGNALRVLGDFRQADKAFQTAELHFSRGWLDPLDEAALLELKALLRRAQRRFDEALELLEESIAIYGEINEPHFQGRAMMSKGLSLQYRGDFQAAEDCFRASLFLLDGPREPRLVGMSQYNLIACLQDAGRTAEAAALIPEARRIMEQVGTRADRLRLRWTEGKVAASGGHSDQAEAALREVREAFTKDSMAFDVALVSLDLATLYLRQRRLEETKRLAAEMLGIFQSRDVHREGLAALIVFQQAAEMEQLTLGQVDELAAYLRQARNDPHLRFRRES